MMHAAGKEIIAAYWDLYDIKTGQLLEEARLVRGKSWPAIGELVVGVRDRPNAIVKEVTLKGKKGNFPYYNVFI